MSKRIKKPRNKSYREKPVTQYGGLSVLAGRVVQSAPLTDEEQITVSTGYYAAITAMIEGRADSDHFDTLVYACNIAQILTASIFSAEHREVVYQALCAIQRCSDRWARNGKFGLDGAGIEALRALGPLHDDMIEQATAAELKAAIAEMRRRIKKGNTFQEREAA